MPGTFLLIGNPGSGKTTLSCTLEHPTLLIDVDCKAHRMANLAPLIERGDITILPIHDRLVEGTFRERALNPDKPLKIQPQGFLKTVDLLNDIIDGKEEYTKYRTIVLDTLTRFSEHLKRLLVYLKGQKKFGSKDLDGDMNWPSWGSYLANLEEVFTALCTMDRNFICNVHEMAETERDKVTDTTITLGFWPMIDGSMRRKLAGYFDEVYYLDREASKVKGLQYKIITAAPKFECARSSLGLPAVVQASSLAELVKEYGTKKKGGGA